jgi:hypothetical protein
MEIIVPRTNAATLSSAENFFASMALAESFSAELAADSSRRHFLVRACTAEMRQQLASQIGATYPQAELRVLGEAEDPARARQNEQVAACSLELRAPAYLPLRTFTDLDVDGERAAQADPVLGILNALGDLPAGWRGLSQAVIQPAAEDWCRDYLRLSVQHPLEPERIRRHEESTLPVAAFGALLLGLVAVGLQDAVLLRAGYWLEMLALTAVSAASVAAMLLLVRRLTRTVLYDMDLVREKITRIACRVQLRVVVYAPAAVPRERVQAQLQRIATVYRRFNLAAANGFVARPIAADRLQLLHLPTVLQTRRRLAVLTTRELAGVWHLPHATADVVLLERTTARRWLPLPTSVGGGCRIGTARHQGREVPVAVPADVLQRHLLLVAKTRRGKSTLMQRLASFAMQVTPRRSVLVVDPHRDLATAVLSVVPAERREQVVFVDVAERRRPVGLNLLDTGLGWDRDRAVANTLAVFQREWGERYWGPRMEDAFRFALLSLFEANLAICGADPEHGRSAQYTLLDVPTMLVDARFRRDVLARVSDPGIRVWWSDYFEALDRRLQLEVSNPVQTKIHRFEGSTAARQIVGQAASTVDPAGWLREGAIVIVNTARGIVGENAAALIGSTLLNLATLAVAEQAHLEPDSRLPISILVDEFHTIPGADYETILAELNKYGANLILATQSLARLMAHGRDDDSRLRATVFANLDGLFAFNCSAEDAEYLVPELGGALDAQDLIELGEHQCYVRLSSNGRRLPTFSVELDPPLTPDPEVAARLAKVSTERFGRDASLVEADRRSALARILQARSSPPPEAAPQQIVSSARNQHRPRKRRQQREVVDAGLTG